ncbi:MAG: hypothetical protein A2W31_00180 [Planctomycetes bacterium RBG_16_64_10]|nr:MAG: hypothetical protein A2W31_00180 [Planctomycetes bacterium RBG_16_64_10]
MSGVIVFVCSLAAASSGQCVPVAPAAPVAKVGIQLGLRSNELERYAADELARYVARLFHVEVTRGGELPGSADVWLLVGSPATNPAVVQTLGNGNWPQVSDQGIVLQQAKLEGKPALVIGGGSPAATLWAVYELVERWGVRYLLSGDVYPEKKREFYFPATDQVMEPVFRARWFKTMGDFAMGMEGWGMADYRPFLDQLAKLKFNRIRVGSSPSQPFLELRIKGIQQQTAVLWYGYRYPITDDMPGRKLFGNVAEFWNPDLPGPTAPSAEILAAGKRHCHELIAYAHGRGIEASFVGSITDFPKEFSPLVPEAQRVSQLGELTVGPGSAVRPDNQALSELSGAVIRTIIDTYAEADSYGFPLGTEWNGWVDAYEWAWQELDKQYAVGEVTSLDDMLRKASQRSYHQGSEHCQRELKGGIAGLYFLARLWSSPEVLPRSQKPDARLIVYEPAEELFPILPRVLPAHAELVIVLDYNPTRVLRKRSVLATVPAQNLPTTLVLTLHDDSVGLLPLLTTNSLHQLVSDMHRCGLSGFCTRQWLISDHDPSIAYLSRAAWDRGTTPQAVWADQIRAVCGEAAVAPMLEAFREIESVTAALEDHGMGLTFPWPGMMTQHWTPEPLTKTRPEDRAGYQRALAAVQRVPPPTRLAGQAYVQYWIGRLEFAVQYLEAVQAVNNAAIAEQAANTAKAKGQVQTYRTQLAEAARLADVAHTTVAQAIESYAGVTRNRADLGAIAILAEYAYRPLMKKSSELRDSLNQ